METTTKYWYVAGIYKLTCVNNSKVYIGKAVNIGRRLHTHKNCVKDGKGNGYFQNAILKHGWDSFTLEVLETITNFDKLRDNDSLLEREAYYIELFDSTDKTKGYNRCKFSTDRTGIPLSDETKEKMRQAKIGKPITEEHKDKIRQAHLNKPKPPLTEEHKQKLRKPKTEETKAKMRKPKSEEAKANMRKPKMRKRK